MGTPRRPRPGLLVLLAVLTAGPGVLAGAPRQAPPRLDDIVAALHRYVQDYEDKLTLIVADENYLQREYNHGTGLQVWAARQIKSEVFFAFTPTSKQWLAVRDVESVDGKSVPNRPDVASMLASTTAKEVASTLKTYNSRYNLGNVYRNFNEPTLSLELFDTVHLEDLAFELKRLDAESGVSLATLGFRERGAPTLIADLDQRPVQSSGEVTVETATGRVRKIHLKSPFDDALSELETTYGHDVKLDFWVPVEFVEHYTAAPDTEIVCRAAYTNFRRFEVHGGIK
jgi:hypothetical protein